jgi:hypothetical protein
MKTTEPTACGPAALAEAAQAALGPEWHRGLARLLGPHHPDGPRDAIDDRLVRRWASGQRAVPTWVPVALASILRDEAASLLRAADALDGDCLLRAADALDAAIGGRGGR